MAPVRWIAPLLLACACGAPDPPAASKRPNVLWIVWDTVRADHLSLYGHRSETSPFLSDWARDARVFDDALSVAGYTLPSHASMFTGLLPSEHCTHNGHPWLDDSFTTVAELLRDAGYRTFLYSANPFVAGTPGANLAQGFEREEHPWSPKWARQAIDLVMAKLPPEDRSSELPAKMAETKSGKRGYASWNVKASGTLARTATLEWLASSDASRPYFVFLNYMEAHRPTIPPRRLRERLLGPAEVDASYGVDRSWLATWEYTFGLREYTEQELALTRATYDAALLELDELLAELLAALDDADHLDDTVVILTADHGEHLGEAHMLDHQYSLHQVLLRVPLVIHAPKRFAPGRESRPVATFDLFPTLLEIAGVPAAAAPASSARSLLAPQAGRRRFAEEPAASDMGIAQVKRAHPDFDPAPFQRRLRALVEGGHKLLWRSDGSRALFDLASDPLETRDLLAAQPAAALALGRGLDEVVASLAPCAPGASAPAPTPQQREMLKGLGYLDPDAGEPSRP